MRADMFCFVITTTLSRIHHGRELLFCFRAVQEMLLSPGRCHWLCFIGIYRFLLRYLTNAGSMLGDVGLTSLLRWAQAWTEMRRGFYRNLPFTACTSKFLYIIHGGHPTANSVSRVSYYAARGAPYPRTGSQT